MSRVCSATIRSGSKNVTATKGKTTLKINFIFWSEKLELLGSTAHKGPPVSGRGMLHISNWLAHFNGLKTCNPAAPLMPLLDVCQSVSPEPESYVPLPFRSS